MARPPKRGAAASETIQFRCTPREKQIILDAVGFHTLSDFILSAVMDRIKKMDEPIQKSHGTTVDTQTTEWPQPSEPLHPPTSHRHKRGALASETTIKGVTIRSWHCAEAGCTEILGGKT